MKKMVLAVATIFLFIGFNAFAADGDLIVNGNVGIGTTNPTEKLTVNGNVKVTGTIESSGGSAAVATGCIMAWPTETVPAGWLELNGAAVSRTTYAALFAVVGTKYGVGDGGSTFNLPDMRGRFLRGNNRP